MRRPSRGEIDALLATMAHEIMAALVSSQGGEAAGVDSGLSLEALAIVAAGLIEANPTIATNRERREEAEKVGALIKGYVRAMRERFERTGQHGAEAFGAILADAKPIN